MQLQIMECVLRNERYGFASDPMAKMLRIKNSHSKARRLIVQIDLVESNLADDLRTGFDDPSMRVCQKPINSPLCRKDSHAGVFDDAAEHAHDLCNIA